MKTSRSFILSLPDHPAELLRAYADAMQRWIQYTLYQQFSQLPGVISQYNRPKFRTFADPDSVIPSFSEEVL
jgi:hypothetical protein